MAYLDDVIVFANKRFVNCAYLLAVVKRILSANLNFESFE